MQLDTALLVGYQACAWLADECQHALDFQEFTVAFAAVGQRKLQTAGITVYFFVQSGSPLMPGQWATQSQEVVIDIESHEGTMADGYRNAMAVLSRLGPYLDRLDEQVQIHAPRPAGYKCLSVGDWQLRMPSEEGQPLAIQVNATIECVETYQPTLTPRP